MSWGGRSASSLPLASLVAFGGAACTVVDPGPNFVVPDEPFDADFFFCRVEPELILAKRCGPGDPTKGDEANQCHFDASRVKGMVLVDHPRIDCRGDHPTDRGGLGAGGGAQANLQSVSMVMSRDVDTAPLWVRPAGLNHPRAIFTPDDPVVDLLRQWARK